MKRKIIGREYMTRRTDITYPNGAWVTYFSDVCRMTLDCGHVKEHRGKNPPKHETKCLTCERDAQ